MVAAATWSLITIRWKSLSESNQEAREHLNDTMQRGIRDCCRSSNEIALNSSGCGKSPVGQRGARLSERQPAVPLPGDFHSVRGCRSALSITRFVVRNHNGQQLLTYISRRRPDP